MRRSTFIHFIAVGYFSLTFFGGWGYELQAQSRYKEFEVRDGGTIHGVVRLVGDESRISSMVITKDNDFCGKTKSSPRLVVGRNKGVANSIISLGGITEGKKRVTGSTRVLDQHACEYRPHVMLVPFGSSIEIVNSDRVLHNVHAYEMQKELRTIFNIAQPIKGQRTPIKATHMKTPGLLLATCDAGHPWMSAYIMIAEHPYYALSDADGRFVLDKIPPGTYQLKMWHEGVAVTQTDTEYGSPKKYHFEEPYETVKDVTVPTNGVVTIDFDLVLR